jgi:TonB family protein
VKLPLAVLLSVALHLAGVALLLLRESRPSISARQGDAILLVGVVDGNGTTDAPQTAPGDGQEKPAAPARQGGIYTGSVSELMNAIEYPEEAIAMEMEGTVEIEVEIGPDGRTVNALVVRPSGHRILDQAARTGVLRWTFTDGENRKMKIPFRFRLK